MWQQLRRPTNWQQSTDSFRYRRYEYKLWLRLCDRVGAGHAAEPAEIVTHIESLLGTPGKRDLVGKRA